MDQNPSASRNDNRPMFKHILVPTDGSPLAAKGVRAGARLAASLGARVTAVYVAIPYMPTMYGDAAAYIPTVSPEEYRKYSDKAARKALDGVAKECRAAGVRHAGRTVTTLRAHEG